MRARGTDSAKAIVMIKTISICGAGTKEDPVREITQYWDLDGNLVATIDPFSNQERAERRSNIKIVPSGEMKSLIELLRKERGEKMIYMTERIVNLNDLKGMSNLAMARAANVKKMISEGAAPEIVSAQMEVLLRELTEINNFEFEIEVRKVRYCE